MALPRIAGNPVEKTIRETEAHISIVQSETRKRRKWATIRADVLSDWATNHNLDVPAIPTPYAPQSNTRAIAEIVGLWIVIGIAAVTLGFAFHWLAATLTIEAVASIAAGSLIAWIASTKHPKPPPRLLHFDDPWVLALQKYFAGYFSGDTRDVAYAGRDAVGRQHFAIWIGTGDPEPGNEIPKF